MASDAPARARNNKAMTRPGASPNPMIASPHRVAATITPIPWRWMCRAQPLVAKNTNEPTAGAAYRRPSTLGPPNPWAMAGNSAIGMPNVMATMSTRYVPINSGRLRAYRDHPDRPAQAHQCRRRGQLVAFDQAGEQSVERGTLHRVERAPEQRDSEDQPQGGVGEQGVAGHEEAAGHQAGLAQEDHGPAIGGVGHGPTEHREHEQRRQLDQPQRADQQRAVRQLVHLVRDGDESDHGAEKRDQPPDEQEPEVAVPPQRRDVEGREAPPFAALLGLRFEHDRQSSWNELAGAWVCWV